MLSSLGSGPTQSSSKFFSVSISELISLPYSGLGQRHLLASEEAGGKCGMTMGGDDGWDWLSLYL